MKLKRLLSVMGLGLFAAISAGAGALLAKDAKAEPVKADADTWMMNFSLNTSDIIGYEGFDVSSMYLHTYTDGVGNDKYFQMYPIETGSQYFQVNATFPEDYTYNRVQFKFTQSEVEKWSTSYNTSGSKDSHSIQGYCTFGGWSGDNWTFSYNSNPNLYVTYNSTNIYFQPDVANKRFVASNVFSDESSYVTFYYRQIWDFAWPTLTNSSKEYTYGSHADNWFNLSSGTYDFVLKNNNDDNGVIDILRHKDETDTCIYYVLENNTPTNDYIYSWGGSEQFGAWPGTKISEIEGVEELTGNGVLHFEGSETPKLIYSIPVSIGYPLGDVYFKFNNNNDWESEQRTLKGEHAYWYTGAANYDAGEAIDFLITAEAYRNGAEDHSVCNVTPENAKFIVDLYNAETDAVRDYVDRSSVYTYKEDKSGEEGLVSYRKVIERLGIIGGVTPVGGSPRNPFVTDNTIEANSAALIAAVSIIAIASISTVAVLVVIKKRKHE